jgi:hypothetical protein
VVRGKRRRAATFKTSRNIYPGVWQTEAANRAKFGGTPVYEFARYAESARQFTDFKISHIRQR